MSAKVSRFEHFEILKDENGELVKLGPGGMGTTYRAYDLHLRKLVALKIINDRTLADPTARRRFFNEARAAASIDHPNVARVIFLCPETAVDCSFAMELVEGETLAKRISQNGPLGPGEALALLRPIADALIALGARGLVHRDIKPENIMTTRSAEGNTDVKLIDFGLAKIVSASSSIFESVHTGERFVGSVYFASPEQIRPTDAGIDCRSDFYSLGATLWHVVTGAPPFKGTVFEVQEAHVYKEPPWEKIAQLPQPLNALLRSLLAKNPAKRPPSAEALVTEWDQAIAALESCPTRLDAAPPSPLLSLPTATASAAPEPAPQPPAALLPSEAVLPPPSGGLAKDAGSGAVQFVRRIPPSLSPEVRSALLRAAHSARNVTDPSLLAVREVTEESVASHWPVAVTAAQVQTWHHGVLPAELMLAWLPRLADAIDAAHARGLAHVSLQPDRVLVEFDAATPLRSTDFGWCKTARLWLDPLSGFDAALVSAANGAGAGGIVRRIPTCATAREYVAALARCLRDLMGGKSDGRARTIDGLDEPRQRLLNEAINYRASAATVGEWARAFVAGAAGAKPPPVKVPRREALPSGGSSPQATTRSEEPSPSPRSTQSADQKPSAAAPTATPETSPPSLLRKAGLAAAATIVLGILIWWNHVPSTDRESEGFRTLMVAAEDALAKGDFSRAQDRATAAEHLHPQNKRLADFRTRLSAAIPPAPPAATPRPRPSPAPASPPEKPNTPTLATAAAPFVNSFGMKFVPVPIVGGPSHGQPVLFSVYETRVRDFVRFANPSMWQPKAFQTPDHPAVEVIPVDASYFANWLTQNDRLPPGWRYRLPTDHEWSCAVGIGAEEAPESPAAEKSGMIRSKFPWGAIWPPPAKAGNFGLFNDGYPATAPVGVSTANSLGLCDLSGNAAEWCFDPAGSSRAMRAPFASTGAYVLRGGCWTSSEAADLLSSARQFAEPEVRRESNGFRLVLTKTPRTGLRPTEPSQTQMGGQTLGPSAPPSIFNPSGR
ncbi:MAG: eukaryotic-like serine/threonine-protein kinase [Chthoniobacter sp.]|jgi:serine/threonine protein kinase|nr:eukaryotic-like serine/threonine-protein kinase [Chthoniobacter sp.]